MSNALKTAANIIEQNVVLMAVNARQQEEISQLKRQLEWFRRHLFGQKSERRNPDLYSLQLAFSDLGGEGNTPLPAPDTQTVAAHSRNKPAKPTVSGKPAALYSGRIDPGILRSSRIDDREGVTNGCAG
ncbi:MAG: transposase [Ferrovum myxofaciens]